MSKPKEMPPVEVLFDLFEYTEEVFSDDKKTYTGGLRWRADRVHGRPLVARRLRMYGTTFAGSFFTHNKSGVSYPVIKVSGYGYYLTHRLVWAMLNGAIPDGYEIDHEDRNPFNNCVGNLRCVKSKVNRKNRSSYRGAASPFVGVSPTVRADGRQMWVAACKMDGRTVRFGTFSTEVEAAIARDVAADVLYAGMANLNFPDLVRALRVWTVAP